jgi:hypothetical protein
MIDFNFNVETETTVQDRLATGYRGRRNFLVSELLQMIIYGTPVKDGFARGGWQVTIGDASISDNRPPDKDGYFTLISGLTALRGAGAFKDVYVKNAVPYINELEDGYSGQAPEGMVKVSLSAFKSMYGDVE